MPDPDWRPLDGFGWEEIAAAFLRCYEGYLIPIRLTAQQMKQRFATEDLDMAASGIAFVGGDVAAIGLVARRGRLARLAAFGVATAHRGKGVAQDALGRLARDSDARQDETMELEVFEHNTPAVRLYERFGFKTADCLLGFEKPAQPSSAAAAGEFRPSTPQALAALLAAEGGPNLPWQLQVPTLARLSAPWQVLHDDEGAFALVDLSRKTVVELRMLYVLPALRGKGTARRLLAAIEGLAGGRPIRAPQLIPSRNETFARALGFTPLQHCQWRMVR